MGIELARSDDIQDLSTLLRSSGLPTEDLVANGTASHWVWREQGQIVGTVGLDVLGLDGVLRSLATQVAARGQGIATRLCEAAEAEARRQGVRALYLLTESAGPFAERLGYRVIERASVPAAVAQHRQFATGCCQCATAMAKPLV